MQKGRSDLRKRGCGSRPCSHTSRGKGERSRALLGGLLAMFLLVGVVGWPDCSPAADGDLKWAYTTGAYVESSPAIASDGTIYVGSNDKKLYALYGRSKLANTDWPMFHHDRKHTGRKP